MHPREAFGFMTQKTDRTPLEFLRVDEGPKGPDKGGPPKTPDPGKGPPDPGKDPHDDGTKIDKEASWKDAKKSGDALAALDGEAISGKVDVSAREQIVGDIRKQVPDVALTEAVMNGASVVINLIMPGGGITGIKTMNDQLIGY